MMTMTMNFVAINIRRDWSAAPAVRLVIVMPADRGNSLQLSL